MAVPRYRIIDTKGAYMSRSAEVVLLELGANLAECRVLGIRAPVNEHLAEGEEVEFTGTPGPHMEPLNPEAHEKMREYWAMNPGASLDPTRSLGVTGGNSINISDVLTQQMDRLLNEAQSTRSLPAPRDDAELVTLRAQVGELSAQVALLLKAATPPTRRVAS